MKLDEFGGTDLKRWGFAEWSISRAYRGFQAAGVADFAILTAWRRQRSIQLNHELMGELEAEIKPYGYTRLRGTRADSGAAGERSFWVNGIPFEHGRELSTRFGQESFIFGGSYAAQAIADAGEDGEVGEFYSNGQLKRAFKDFHPTQPDAGFYSTWRGRPFRFEAAEDNWIGGMGLDSTKRKIAGFVNSLPALDEGEKKARIRDFVDGMFDDISWRVPGRSGGVSSDALRNEAKST